MASGHYFLWLTFYRGYRMKSMTGFGKAEQKTRLGSFSIEVSSVNNRFLETSIRLPRQFSALEYRVKELIGEMVERGKVYVYVGFTESDELPERFSVNQTAAAAYARQLDQLRRKLKLGGEVTVADLLVFPEVARSEDVVFDDDEVWKALSVPLKKALKALIAMRKKEGDAMARDMAKRLKEIKSLTGRIEKDAGRSVDMYRERLRERVTELAPDIEVDPVRLEQEVVLHAERADITEECTRMYSHLDQYAAGLRQTKPAGKRLNFILQEMNREANTIASKCSETSITRAVISVKEEIEKLRELVQNAE